MLAFPADRVGESVANCFVVAFFGDFPDFEPALRFEEEEPDFEDFDPILLIGEILEACFTPEVSVIIINFPVLVAEAPGTGFFEPFFAKFAVLADPADAPPTPNMLLPKFDFGACFGSRRIAGTSVSLVSVAVIDELNTFV